MKSIISLSLFSLLSLPSLAAESVVTEAPASWRDELSFNTEVGFNSRYMFEGLAYSENPVMNPAVSSTFKNLTAGFWSNMNFNEEGSEGKFNEIDLNLAYEWTWNNLTITPEYIHYIFPNTAGAENTGEFALAATYTFFDDLIDIHTKNKIDVKENKGAYTGTFGIGASHEYNDRWSIGSSLDAFVACNKANKALGFRDEWALRAMSVSIESNFQLTPALYVKPNLMFSTIVSPGIRDDAKTANIDRDVFSGGLALGADF